MPRSLAFMLPDADMAANSANGPNLVEPGQDDAPATSVTGA